MFLPRCSGVLLHVTSLPSPYGVGDLGSAAGRMVEFLHQAGQRVWQVLPLTPVSAVHGYSPYCSTSAFAASGLVLSPRQMVQEGLLHRSDLEDAASPASGRAGRADYPRADAVRNRLLEIAFRRLGGLGWGDDFDRFCRRCAHWLDDYALFEAIRRTQGLAAWTDWPRLLRDRDGAALAEFARSAGPLLRKIRMVQYLFDRQWSALRGHCRRLGVLIVGDLPFYVAHDSADVWAHRECFHLDRRGRPRLVSGTPPDLFSRTGQLWGNPVFDWDRMRQDGYAWWLDRMDRNHDLYDIVRVDHFRGIAAAWHVKAGQPTAARGHWTPGPGADLLRAMRLRRPAGQILAEDLGTITPDVRELMREFALPGMRPLLFAFGPDMPRSIYSPHNHTPDNVVYTGTHDNNTVRGWLEDEAGQDDRRRLEAYLGRPADPRTVAWDLVRLGMQSPAACSIFPMQDLLGLDGRSRMNHPAQPGPHWLWRMTEDQLTDELAERLAEMTRTYGRADSPKPALDI